MKLFFASEEANLTIILLSIITTENGCSSTLPKTLYLKEIGKNNRFYIRLFWLELR